MRAWVGGVAAATMMTAAMPVWGAEARDERVWAAVEAERPAQLKLLQQVVDIDSGTGDVEGGRKVADILAAEFQALGMSVERVPAESPGLADNLVARIAGTGRGRVLLIGHLDTVFEPGTAAKRPFRIDGDRALGPGVADEKGGVVSAIAALKAMKAMGAKGYRSVTVLIESSEERGSPGTRKLIARLLADADVELNLEPGDEPDVITVWRKGAQNFTLSVTGRASHAGVAPQDGRNAALELIHQIDQLSDLPRTGDGMTANLTLMKAGSRNNIIPDTAEATFNVRIRDKAQGEAVLARMRANAAKTAIPDTRVEVTREIAFPPLTNNASTDALAAQAQAIYAGLGRTITTGGNGGASESAMAAEAGTPALDGLGPVGGGSHTDDEHIDLRTMTPRTYLLTKLIMALGANPPPRMAVRP